MKPRKSAPFRSHASITAAFSVALFTHFTAQSVFAAGPYYWDNNTTTAGFGTAGGTWSSAGSTLWNGDSAGGSVGGLLGTTITTDTTDSLNFGTSTAGLATGPIAVSGIVQSGDMTFGTASGNITFTGGTITTAVAVTINTGGKTIWYDTTALSGATTSVTYTGGGTLKMSGGNGAIAGGDFNVNQGILLISNTSTAVSGANALGGSDGWTVQLGDTSGAAAATLNLGNSITLPNPITVRTGSSGTKTLGVGAGTISAIYSGVITANDSLTVLHNTAGTGSITVNNAGNTVASTKTVTYTLNTAATLTDSATWGGDGNLAYSGSGIGTINVTGAKTHTGGSTLGSMSGATGVVVVNTSSAGPANAPTSGPFGTGTLTIGATKLQSKTGSDTTVGNAITFSGNPTFATVASEKSLIFTGDADLGAATRTLTVNTGSTVAGKVVDFQGSISSATAASGITKAGTGTLTLSGASSYTGNTTVTGGTLNITGTLNGTSLLLGTTAAKTVVNVSNDMTLSTITGGSVVNSFAVYNQTAGTVTTVGNGALTHVANGGGYGYLNLTGGSYSQTANRFSVTSSTGTAGGAGVVYVGGTAGQVTLDLTGTTSMIIGYTGGAPASLTVGPGGTVNRPTAGNFWLTTNANSYGVLNVAGGDFNTAGSGIRVGNGATTGHTGFVNLAKGTLTLGLNGINGISTGGTGSLYSNYTGGTLKAANNLTAVVPVTNATLTSVATVFGPIDNSAAVGNTSQDFTGGLTVDNNGYAVTFGSPLLGATGNGVKQANMTVTGGTGYIGAPMVQFTGGTGTPAAGYAVITGGAVTGIVITSPGDYTVDPTGVTLIGGGGSGASVTLGVLTANTPDSGLTKINNGTLTLSGANTYTGATLVSGGTLKSSTAGSATTDITVATSAAGGALVASEGGQWINTGDLTLNNNSTLVIDYGITTPSTTVAPIAVDNFNVGTNLGLKLEADSISGFAISQSYPLATWTTNGPADGSAFTSIDPSRLAGNFSVVGKTLKFTVTAITQYALSWNTGDGTWDSIASNWVDGTLTPRSYVNGFDSVLFGDAAGATGNPTITLNSTFSPTSVTMSSSSRDYTISGSGVIAGSGSLTLGGANTRTMTLLNTNTYSGGTTISGGTLQLGNGATLGSVAGNIVDNAALVVANDPAQTIGGVISGTGTLTKQGSGVLTLSGSNGYTGTTTVSSGTLSLNNATALGGNNPGVNGTSSISMAAGTTLRSNYIIVDAGNVDSFVYAPITLSGSGSVNFHTGAGSSAAPAEAVTFNLNGAIGGSAGTNVVFSTVASSLNNADSIFVLGAASTYDGSTTITVGDTANKLTVKAGVANALPSTTVLTLDGGAGSGTGRFLQYDLNGNNQTLAGLQNVTGLSLRSQRVTNTGAAATLTVNNSDPYSFGGTVTTTSTATSRIEGAISLVKSAGGTFTLVGAQTYTGDTTVNQGTLSLGGINPSNESSTVTIAPGATLDLAFTGTDTVNKLFFGTTQQPSGTYSASSVPAGATITTASFSGTGTLTVGGGFSSWITGTFANGTVPGGLQGPNDDPDNDGISNLVEYAIAGEDPTVSKAAIGSFDGTTLSFTKRAGANGLTYAIQDSTDLGIADAWTEVTGVPPVYVNDGTTISYTLTPGTPARNFLRLQVLSN